MNQDTKNLVAMALLTVAFALLVAACTPAVDGGDIATSTPPVAGEGATEDYGGFPPVADLVEQVAPAVVSIVTQSEQRGFLGTVPATGSGSGVVFNEDGYILTNNHVIEDATAIKVTLLDGRELDAELIGRDPRTDLAVVKVDEDGLTTAVLGDTSVMRVGEWVVAIGNALGLRGAPTVTVGVVSAMGRSLATGGGTLSGLVQTDAAINTGNSGGPLINLRGEVIGINTAVLRGLDAEGIGFAVSTETAIPVTEQLISNGRVVRAYLGVGLGELNRSTAAEMGLTVREGVIVRSVQTGTPADSAGLEADDVITALGDQAVPDIVTLERLLIAHFEPGQTITVTVVRGDEEQTLNITLGENPG